MTSFTLPDSLKYVMSDETGVPAANVVSVIDDRMVAWANSRPNITELHREEMTETFQADFGIADQCYIKLQLRTSVLFRELVSSLRGTTMWAQTSRVNPIDKVSISHEYYMLGDAESFESAKATVRRAADDFENGMPQDLARLTVPVTASTCYFLGAPLRTWVILCKILRQINSSISVFYSNLIWSALVKALNVGALDDESILEGYKFDTKNLAIKSLRVSKEEIEAGPTSVVCSGISIVRFETTVGMAAQFARHQHNQYRTSIWDYFELPIDKHHDVNLKSKVTVVTAMPESSYKTILSHRAEWLADWNMWSGFVEAGTKDFTDEEFFKLLDDPMNYIGDNMERIKLTDPNLPDVRILEMPVLIDQRISKEGNNYISNRWRTLADQGFFKDNPSNEYRQTYLTNLTNKLSETRGNIN